MNKKTFGGWRRRWLKLPLMLMLLMSLAYSEWALIDIKDPSGTLRVDDARMSTSSGGYCGYETAQPLGSTECDYEHAYSSCDQEGNWNATVTVKTRYCDDIFGTCAGGGSNSCNNVVYCGSYFAKCCEMSETSVETILYNINWDGDENDCTCRGGTWLNNKCCGDDGNEDDYGTGGASCCIDGTVVTNGNSKDGLTCTAGQITGSKSGCDVGQYVSGISSDGTMTCANDPTAISLLDAGDDMTVSGDTDRTLALGTNIDLSKLIVEGSIKYTGSTTGGIFYRNGCAATGTPGCDGFRIRYNVNDLIIEKTDNGANVLGGIAFVGVGYNGATTEGMEIQPDGDVGIKKTLYGIDSSVVISGNMEIPRLRINAGPWPYDSVLDGNGHIYLEGWNGYDGGWWDINKFADTCNSANVRAIRFYPFCSGDKLRMYLQACRESSPGSYGWYTILAEEAYSCDDYNC